LSWAVPFPCKGNNKYLQKILRNQIIARILKTT
jgi:hypothetical protein